MIGDANNFKKQLKDLGISSGAIDAVWPIWWSDDANSSKSAQVELRFSVARKLGLSPRSVIGEESPVFVWRHEAKFKGLNVYNDTQESALASFAIALARYLTKACPPRSDVQLSSLSASALRTSILKQSDYVSLPDLLATCWGLGIPVIHLRVFPLSAKRMTALVVKHCGRHVIFIGKDSSYPAPTAYHLAHEMGHIARQHFSTSEVIVDLDEPIEMVDRDDDELEADAYALELLTGQSQPTIEMNAPANNGAELAYAVRIAARERQIEPGTLALCYGHQTGEWNVSYSALAQIYRERHDVWKFINRIAAKELELDILEEGTQLYLKAVLGAAEFA
tara:strand:+ start:18256 stop:19263 length:1008 start_codon:yes stop_codon:yes gene_type:complete